MSQQDTRHDVQFAGDHDEKAVAGATGLILDAKGTV